VTEQVVFYTNPMSRGRIVQWMLDEIGAPYETRTLSLEKGEHKTPAYLAINPMGKVPAIVHRGVVVTETAAICLYLADEFPAAGLAPKIGDPQRGTYLRWFLFGAGCIEPAIIDKMLARPPVERKTALGYGSADDALKTLETAVAPGPWILGDRFSAVDVYVGSQVHFGFMTKSIDPTPVLQKYADRCSARPALQKLLQGAR
jgi:glutathione S-transferase